VYEKEVGEGGLFLLQGVLLILELNTEQAWD